MPVELLTRSGEAVTKQEIPKYNRPPDAILWGMRFFMRRPDGKYYEGFVHLALNPPALQGVPAEEGDPS